MCPLANKKKRNQNWIENAVSAALIHQKNVFAKARPWQTANSLLLTALLDVTPNICTQIRLKSVYTEIVDTSDWVDLVALCVFFFQTNTNKGMWERSTAEKHTKRARRAFAMHWPTVNRKEHPLFGTTTTKNRYKKRVRPSLNLDLLGFILSGGGWRVPQPVSRLAWFHFMS